MAEVWGKRLSVCNVERKFFGWDLRRCRLESRKCSKFATPCSRFDTPGGLAPSRKDGSVNAEIQSRRAGLTPATYIADRIFALCAPVAVKSSGSESSVADSREKYLFDRRCGSPVSRRLTLPKIVLDRQRLAFDHQCGFVTIDGR
jgi:hypothetical protein